ncbi:MAG: beta-phosphoglucomutase family hydrolase [Candidatus Omnitrophica bacterium]|nr:beta-phosphoglucomutase family hydrolase [Candidatus Omnitrophota bacterium]MCB9747124.1 beta-phosphoglucomutase family hydrolase [Candidatus Omnitrophota bacterium]
MNSFEAVIFDLDGVITKTAKVHAAAWKAMFDEYLQERAKQGKEAFREFSYEQDYLTYVDGKPRYKGVESFLKSRNISIPFGNPTDLSKKETICGLGNRKNEKFVETIEKEGVDIYIPMVKLIKELKEKGIHIGVASSSKNCELVLQTTELDQFFETRVDGIVSAKLGLKGKPEGDIFVKAAENMGVSPDKAIVIEDAVSGVQAGKNGGFGLVIGMARENNEEDLLRNGADIVKKNFEGITIETLEQWFKKKNKL